ncbi:633_t:CDS:2, partial [Racocetra persica]
MDINYDWVSNSRHLCSNIDIMDTSIFVQQASSNTRAKNNKNLVSKNIDYEMLNKKQKIVLNRIKSHYCNILEGYQIDLLRIIIMRTTAEVNSPLLVLTSTGVAAFNINRLTINLALSIPICTKNFDIGGEKLNQLQERLQNVKYIILDEKSM